MVGRIKQIKQCADTVGYGECEKGNWRLLTWICEAWRSIVMMWSAPATDSMLATSLADIGALLYKTTFRWLVVLHEMFYTKVLYLFCLVLRKRTTEWQQWLERPTQFCRRWSWSAVPLTYHSLHPSQFGWCTHLLLEPIPQFQRWKMGKAWLTDTQYSLHVQVTPNALCTLFASWSLKI